ncbi:anthranilate phosphoribosyltransferase [Microbacteriaceae bacterium MWH-Ta3]|nr:anthranilate phosphoribosyltransferase [Microbacteriaceae bacterium MWH-Ta3]
MTSANWSGLIETLLAGESLSIATASGAMRSVMNGTVTEAQLAAFLVALRAKGESVDEVVGFRDAILEAALPLDISANAVDIVGSGGDPVGVTNVSSIASIVVSAAGIPVIKHGNRAASSKSGASDILTELGVNISIEADAVARVFSELSLTYVNAMVFHPGFRNAGPVRTQLGIPTIFNILGPLCNPARPNANALGVSNPARIPLVVGVFQTRGAAALVYRGEDGIDKITTTGHSHVWEVARGSVTEHDFDPREIGFAYTSIEDIRGGTAAENAEAARKVFAGESGAVRDIVLLNAAAGIVAYQLSLNPAERDRSFVERMSEGVDVARRAIDSGAAATQLAAWVAATN